MIYPCVSYVYLVFIEKKSEIYSVFLIFESRFSVRFVTGSEEHEVFLPEYFQSTILHAAHFRREVNTQEMSFVFLSIPHVVAIYSSFVHYNFTDYFLK